jgi:hypothetical protein
MGFMPQTRLPSIWSALISTPATTVFPTPVSVPVTKNPLAITNQFYQIQRE